MKLHEYVDIDLLDYALEHGYVRQQKNAFETLAILNYTPKAQYEKRWDDATLKCRGLIYDLSTQEIVAQPFPKFFNYGEVDRGMLPDGPIRVQEKMDGSLGILYIEPITGVLFIATRGSFTSPQAQHATRLLWDRYPDFRPLAGCTYLFEIIYPENRIVVDYGDANDLVLLDVLLDEHSLLSDEYIRQGNDGGWSGPVAETYPFESLTDVLKAPERANCEGFVVRFEKTGDRVKVKYEEYVRLHRIVTNVSTTVVWEMLSTGADFSQILDNVPDEFYRWVKKQVASLHTDYSRVTSVAWDVYSQVIRQNVHYWPTREQDPKGHRKAFAKAIQDSDLKGLLFAIYDDRSTDEMVWKMIKPKHATPSALESV